MAHNHGNEYQIRIVHEDGTEELSGLLNSIEQGKTYWLLVRNILCHDCSDKKQITMECPITNIPSPRYMPHDSGYLQIVESRDRYSLGFSASRHTG